MRDQYAGDVSDVLKFAFLRTLAGEDRTLGVAWYYAPGHDGRTDGRHLEWKSEPAWQRLDAELHAGLSMLPERSVAALEQTAIWPKGTLFHREPMPSRLLRAAWGERKRVVLDAADVVILDPDNGLGAETPKHATPSQDKFHVCELERPRTRETLCLRFVRFGRGLLVRLCYNLLSCSSPSRRLLLPGFQRFGHPLRRRI